MKRFTIGDACICWSLGETIERETSATVLDIYRTLKEDRHLKAAGIRDIVPTYNGLAVHFDPADRELACTIRHIEGVMAEILEGLEESAARPRGNRLTLPVVYDGEDIRRVADLNGLSRQEVVQFHTAATYTVAMVGFLPHFPYLIGLDPRLETPRMESPRTKVPAGAVAIGGAQTGIYPRPSPGGWNIIGSTDPEGLREIQPGDTVIFRKVHEL